MTAFSRRDFFRRTASNVATAGFVSATALRANPLGMPLGSQTYFFRQRIKDGDFAGLCRDLAQAGIGSMELCSPGYAEFASLADGKQTRKILEDHGLKCPSAHFMISELQNRQPQAIAWAKDIGMTQMGLATLGQVNTADGLKKLADEYNKIGEAAAKAGLQQFLHGGEVTMAAVKKAADGYNTTGGPAARQLEMAKADLQQVYEVLFELFDPKVVKFQFQMSSVKPYGDPVKYFTKYPARFVSIHLSGVDLNAPPTSVRLAVGAPGKDTLDWPSIFAAAKDTAVKNMFIELPWDTLVPSAAYLKTLNV